MKPTLILSCEHAVNLVPATYKDYFQHYKQLLDTHYALDLGSLTVACHLSKYFVCTLVQAQATRLLIDCNRTLTHRSCFSQITKNLPKTIKQQIIADYYLPFRCQVEDEICKAIDLRRQVWHLSIHSFTQVMNNLTRNADIGLLYDPQRENEQILAKNWERQLKLNYKNLRVRRNYPYRGIADGFTTALRKIFAPNNYLGIEVEINQGLVQTPQSALAVATKVADTLFVCLQLGTDIP